MAQVGVSQTRQFTEGSLFNGWKQIAPARTITTLGYTVTLTAGSNIAALSGGATALADFRAFRHVLICRKLFVVEAIPSYIQLQIWPTTDARHAVCEWSLNAQQIERAGKLSSGSIRAERQIEGLRGDACAALRLMPEYRTLSAKDQKAVRDLIGKELKWFKAEAASMDTCAGLRREKSAQIPDWTPEELARAAVTARQ